MDKPKENDKPASKEFSGIQAILWPIHAYEVKKFLPMAFIMMGMILVYSLLRGLKDTLVVMNMGAEMIPTLKMWFVFPSALLFMILYFKLSNVLSKNAVFYTILSIFVSYFAIIGCIFQFSDPAYFHFKFHCSIGVIQNLLDAIGSWVYSSFYIMSELWGSLMVGLMFWKFANDVTSVKEAKRFYAMFGLIGNFALIASGIILKSVNSASESTGGKWEAFPIIVSAIVVTGVVIVSLYWWVNSKVLTDPRFYNPNEEKKTKKKEKLSLSESFKYVFTSKYIMLIAMLVICYGISINLVEVMWKSQVGIMCEGSKDLFKQFMGNVQVLTGICAVTLMLVAANILRRLKWITCALMTPLMIGITGVIFFIFVIFRNYLDPYVIQILGVSSVVVTSYLGMIQNALGKGTKYSLFDTTKEMTYIPLDDELKSKGKAAVEVVGSRLGKSGGAFINWILLNVFFVGSNLVELSPIITVIFVFIMAAWIYAVKGLNKEFLKVTEGEG